MAFAAIIAALLLLERWSPWRREKAPLQERWITNIGLMLVGAFTGGMLLGTDLESIAAGMPGGTLRDQALPLWAEVLVVVLLLDLWRYWEHRIFHEVPTLWRAHLVHHSDTALDITTSQRHHPLEVALVVFTGALLLFALGYSAQALGVYLLLASISSLVTHASIRLPGRVDRALRLLVVTPAVHAVHHSDLQRETDSNYGTLFTVWDRLFGTYISPDRAQVPHYGLEYFHRPEDTTFGAVLLQPFLYRAGADFYPARDEVAAAAPTRDSLALSPAWRQALKRLALSLGLCLAVLWPTVASLLHIWVSADTYQYAWWVLPVLLYVLAWHRRGQLLLMTPAADYAGLWLVAPGVVLWCAGYLVDIQLAQHLALVVVLQGVLLCALGRRVYAGFFPAFAMLFLLVPSGDLLQLPLRALTVYWIEGFAALFELPYVIEGYVAYIGDFRYVVVDACSGLTYVLMGGFLGYSFGLLLYRSLAPVVALAFAGALLGVVTNALRVWLILTIDWLNNTQMDMEGHTDVQWLAMLLSMGGLLYLAASLAGAAGEPPGSAPPVRAARPSRPLASALSAGLVVATLGSVQLLDRFSADDVHPAVDQLAARYPGARVVDGDSLAQRALVIPYRGGMEAVLLQPSRGYGRVSEHLFYPDDPLWRHAGTGHVRDCVADQCIDFIHKVFKRKESDQERHVFYAYFVGTASTASQLDYRLAGGLRRLLGGGAAAGALGFRMPGEAPPDSVLASAFLGIRGDMAAGGGNAPAVVDLGGAGFAPGVSLL